MLFDDHSYLDGFLVNRINKGDVAAAILLLELHLLEFLNICRQAMNNQQFPNLESPEALYSVVSQIFVDKTQKNAFAKNPFKGLDNVYFWFKRVAKNKVIDAARNAKTQPKLISSSEEFDIADEFSDPVQDIFIKEWIDTLSDELFEVVDLKAQGYTYREVGDRLGISHETVSRRLREAYDLYLCYSGYPPKKRKAAK